MDEDPAREREAIVAGLALRTSASGVFSGPCIPALFDHYLDKLLRLFETIDRPLTGSKLSQFRDWFRQSIERGFQASPYARFILSYGPAGNDGFDLGCDLSLATPPLDEQYQRWLANPSATDQPFGKHPDAKVIDVGTHLRALGSTGAGAPIRVLDVGAGTGRNALALAGLGHAVDAIEPVPALAQVLAAAAAQQRLTVNISQRDVLHADTMLEDGRYALIVLSEVATHFSPAQLTLVLPKLARSLTPDGTLLFNAFLSRDGYWPSPAALEVAQVVWSTFFSRQELAALAERAGLLLVHEEPCLAYEQARQPPADWPPTRWYVGWAQGHNLFDKTAGPAPIELHWLEYRRSVP